MLNLKGAFVVIFTNAVQVHLLGCKALADYYERTAIVGFDKTNKFTFGGEALAALPCTLECMLDIAMNYPDSEPMARDVKGICACIASGKPIPNGSDASDSTEGGLGIKAAHTRPKAPKGGSGAAVKPATVQA